VTEPLLALVGPTASGKSSIAVETAEALGAEIVSADSMTVYRGMDVGTAKPTEAERARVPHHVLDVADPRAPFTVAEYQRLAREAIADIGSRAGLPLVVGGSGLYFRAAVDDLKFPPSDPAVRAQLETEDSDKLARRLKEQDPDALSFIDPANRRRVVRALEVIELTGRPFSSFREEWDRYEPATVAGLRVSDETLDARIRARLVAMLEGGLLDEVRRLIGIGCRDALTSSQAIAYREAIAVLDGLMTEGEFLEESARATRRLARRQMSWFRRDPRIRWFDADHIERARAEVRAYYEEHLTKGSH
jgi:tRNA dimethylallyltransferase